MSWSVGGIENLKEEVKLVLLEELQLLLEGYEKKKNLVSFGRIDRIGKILG